MRHAVLLGLRLAAAHTGAARFRSSMVALSAAIGTWLLLCVAAIARAEQFQDPELYSSADMKRLLLAVVSAVALPVLVLAATVGRLSAALRDQRLANLRLLGLTPIKTRMVAVTEVGGVSTIGAGLGLLVFALMRPAMSYVGVAGRHWTSESLRPHLSDYLVVVVLVPLVVIALAALPRRLDISEVMVMARKAAVKRPSSLRIVPLVAGLALCGYVISQRAAVNPTGGVITCFLGGVVMLGVGVLMVVPIFVRLLADLMLRISGGPVTTIAARRLQAQPASVTRVISGLVIGLFLVTGARSVVVAFETTPQYLAAQRQLTQEQRIVVQATFSDTAAVVAKAKRVAGVRRVVAFSALDHDCDRRVGDCMTALVGTCADLHMVAPHLTGCRDDQSTWLNRQGAVADASVRWKAPTGKPERASISLPAPTTAIHGHGINEMSLLGANTVFVPRSLIGRGPVLKQAPIDVLVIAQPGRRLADELTLAGLPSSNHWEWADYDFVAGLRAMVWAIAAVILSVGLLAFGVAAIDRALGRRREVMSLQLVGVSPRLLRRTQWVEAALPIVLGAMFAIGLGLLAGATYLSLGDTLIRAPWQQSLTLLAVSVVSGGLIAGLTVLAASPRIRPDLIRTE
ncbi:MAG: FtsX-like permease family protein [Nocardioidaceae bacterium]